MEIPGYKAPFSPQQAASRKYPLQFLCDLAYTVLTCDLLEYHHLMKHPKYKDVWTKSFGTEIRRLATTTETIFFIKKDEIPQERRGDETYARIVCVYRDGKKDKYRTRITMGGILLITQVTVEPQQRIYSQLNYSSTAWSPPQMQNS